MQAKLLFASVLSALSLGVLGDVWSPTIISPTTGTVWYTGTIVNVTWETADAPVVISNAGEVQLDEGGDNLGIILASDFDLRTGYVEVTVPEVSTGDSYEITLYGDSGNISNDFTIVESSESTE